MDHTLSRVDLEYLTKAVNSRLAEFGPELQPATPGIVRTVYEVIQKWQQDNRPVVYPGKANADGYGASLEEQSERINQGMQAALQGKTLVEVFGDDLSRAFYPLASVPDDTPDR